MFEQYDWYNGKISCVKFDIMILLNFLSHFFSVIRETHFFRRNKHIKNNNKRKWLARTLIIYDNEYRVY